MVSGPGLPPAEQVIAAAISGLEHKGMNRDGALTATGVVILAVAQTWDDHQNATGAEMGAGITDWLDSLVTDVTRRIIFPHQN